MYTVLSTRTTTMFTTWYFYREELVISRVCPRLVANTRYNSKVTWWTSSRTRRGNVHRRETSLTVDACETRDNFVHDMAVTPCIGR